MAEDEKPRYPGPGKHWAEVVDDYTKTKIDVYWNINTNASKDLMLQSLFDFLVGEIYDGNTKEKKELEGDKTMEGVQTSEKERSKGA